MELDELKSQIRAFVAADFYVPDPAALDDRASLLEAGILDSTGVLELIAFLETSFGITVDDSEIVPENLDSIERAACFVRGKRLAALAQS